MGRRQEVDLDLLLGEQLLRSFDANENLGAPGARKAGKDGLVELEVDRRKMMDVGARDAVDAPNAGVTKGGSEDRRMATFLSSAPVLFSIDNSRMIGIAF
jgi:hypothetical protein